MLPRRRLRLELRKLRLGRELSLDEVTKEMEWSVSKIVRIESGSVGISVNDLKALLGLYRVTDAALRDELVELARVARLQRPWWTAYRQHLSSTYTDFIGFEAEAVGIRQFHPLGVIGLLQTEGYARAVMAEAALGDLTPEQVEAKVEIRMRRQREVLDQPDPPDITMILDEAVLLRPVGGRAVMRDQLDHLIERAQQRNLTLVVVPLAAGGHPGLNGAFALFEFADERDTDVVYLEHAPADVIIREKPGEVAQYRRAFERLVEIGLRDDAAVDLIRQARDRL